MIGRLTLKRLMVEYVADLTNSDIGRVQRKAFSRTGLPCISRDMGHQGTREQQWNVQPL